MFRLSGLLLLMCMCLLAGCAMSPALDDYSYNAYGGKWQRDNMTHGRVGSAFAPAEAMVVGDVIDSSEPQVLDAEEYQAEFDNDHSILR
jgi:hypothetical protein